jgi:hypothetical protein
VHPKEAIYSRIALGTWLCAIGWWGFCPFGHEGSCQLFSIRVSTAVTWQLSLRFSLESIRGLLGKYKKNMSYLIGGLPAMPLFPLTILYKSVNVLKPSSTTGQQMQTAVSLLGYIVYTYIGCTYYYAKACCLISAAVKCVHIHTVHLCAYGY